MGADAVSTINSLAPAPMPVWLRTLGVVVCFLPPNAVVLVLDSDTSGEAVGSFLWTLILSSFFLFIPLIVCLLFTLAWLLGWRPGALAGSILLALTGPGLSLDLRGFSALGLVLGPPLDLHFLLIGILLWEWKQASNHQRPEPLEP